MGFAWSSNPYGITDPNGNPCCLRESVERLPTRPRYTNVRARSAKVGSAIAGCIAPEPACFPAPDEDILFSHHEFGRFLCPGCLGQINTPRLGLSVYRNASLAHLIVCSKLYSGHDRLDAV